MSQEHFHVFYNALVARAGHNDVAILSVIKKEPKNLRDQMREVLYTVITSSCSADREDSDRIYLAAGNL